MPADEFQLMAAWYEQHPPGEREDSRIALLCTIMANTHSKKRFKLSDFMPRRASKPTMATLKDKLMRWVWSSSSSK